MNERIKQLADQAGIHFHNGSTLDAGPDGIAKFVLFADMERFAELIGRDMLKLANRHGNIKEHSINEYFGFENDFGINTNNIKRFVNERTATNISTATDRAI